MSTQAGIPKGARLEEVLRTYFLDMGYFVVRDAKLRYEDDDVTDIDLWLYIRPSALSRERTLVDIKDKRKAHAVERIFWAKGLQTVLRLERCVVATPDGRPSIREYGRRNGVTILGGQFLSRLTKQVSVKPDRLTEEELIQLLDPDGMANLRGDWPSRLAIAKSRLLTNLDFSGCNTWLLGATYYAEQCISDQQRRALACRLLYLTLAYFLVALDYVLKDLSFLDATVRADAMKEGFLHGTGGLQATTRALDQAIAFVKNYLPNGAEAAELLRKNLLADLERVPADILTQFFSRTDVQRGLFSYALAFEAHAYARALVLPGDLHSELKAVLGVALDFAEIERRLFFDSFQPPQAP